MLAQGFSRTIVRARSRAGHTGRTGSVPLRCSDRMVPISDFSGLTSCAWALASAAAIVPIVSLDRCMTSLRFEEIEADCAQDFRALGPNPVSNCLLGVLQHETLSAQVERSVMVQKGLPCIVRMANSRIEAPYRRCGPPRSWVWAAQLSEARGLAAFDATPELALGGDDKMSRRGHAAWVVISTHLPPPVITERTALRAATTHILCYELRHVLLGRRFLRERHGSMNLASKTASLPWTRPSSSRHHPPQCRMADPFLNINDHLARVHLIPAPVQLLGRSAELGRPDCQKGRPARFQPRFSRQSRRRAASASPIMIRASEPPMKMNVDRPACS